MNEEDQDILITKSIMRHLDEWGLEGQEIIDLLALPEKTRTRHLEKYRNGTAFPKSSATIARIEHIAGIADALRTTFPRNAHMGLRWLRTPHRRFNNKTPLETILRSDTGLFRVRSELDCVYAWDQSGS